MMEKAFRNLLMNAIRYTPENQGNEIRICMKYIDVMKETVYISIKNTGVHIPEEAIPHLFEAFYRVEQSRNRQTGGSGLGLYIVKTALEQHSASYGICNTQEGVEFSFSF